MSQQAENRASERADGGRAAAQPSFDQVFQRFAPYVLHALPYLGVEEADREDICQEVFLAVYKNLASFAGRSSLRTWIYGICLNKVMNYRRRRSLRRREMLRSGYHQGARDGQEERIEQRQSLAFLQEALVSLGDKKREVFVLYEIEELSMPEVARAARCPLFTAYSRLYAARREVKRAAERLMAGERRNRNTRSKQP